MELPPNLQHLPTFSLTHSKPSVEQTFNHAKKLFKSMHQNILELKNIFLGSQNSKCPVWGFEPNPVDRPAPPAEEEAHADEWIRIFF